MDCPHCKCATALSELPSLQICNCPVCIALPAKQDFKAAAAILHTAVYLSFPQFHNLMAAMAAAWGFDTYCWMHSDAVILKKDKQVGLVCGGCAHSRKDNLCGLMHADMDVATSMQQTRA